MKIARLQRRDGKRAHSLHVALGVWVGFFIFCVGWSAIDGLSDFGDVLLSPVAVLIFVGLLSAFLACFFTTPFMLWWMIRHRGNTGEYRMPLRLTVPTAMCCLLIQVSVSHLVYGVLHNENVAVDFLWLLVFLGMPAVCAEFLYRVERRRLKALPAARPAARPDRAVEE